MASAARACNEMGDYIRELKAEVHQLREALIPFACMARRSAERLGLAEEWEAARGLVGLASPERTTGAPDG